MSLIQIEYRTLFYNLQNKNKWLPQMQVVPAYSNRIPVLEPRASKYTNTIQCKHNYDVKEH